MCQKKLKESERVTHFKIGRFTFTVILSIQAALNCEQGFAQDQNWESPFNQPTFSSTTNALASDANGRVYAGGSFNSQAGYNHLALWTGQHWTGLGTGTTNGVTNTVNAILVAGTNVYVGGSFAGINNQYFGYVACWDGTHWHQLGAGANAGLSSTVYALATDGKNVYAGGHFTVAGGNSVMNIAGYDGTNWFPLASGLGDTNATVRALAFGSDGYLYAGGGFTNSAGTAMNRVGRWDGTNWSAMDAGVDNLVLAIQPIGTNVYIAGTFANSGATPLKGVAQWTGAQWGALGTGLVGGTATSLTTDGTNLFVGGSFTTAGGFAASKIAKWNGLLWSAMGTGMNANVDALVSVQGQIYAAGDFTTAGSLTANRFARWDGQQWYGFYDVIAGGSPGQMNVITVAGTNVYAGGDFTTAGGISANRIARWDGSRWSGLGNGTNNGVDTMPWAIAVSPSGQVYVGGFFAHAGAIAASGIARWDGTNWNALGGGINSGGIIHALAFAPNGDLYAGGKFTSISGVTVNNIARWDGTNWWDVGSGGLTSTMGVGTVAALKFVGTNLYIGGNFNWAGNQTTELSSIAVWNGSAWAPVGPIQFATGTSVQALAYDGTNLFAAGGFTQLGGVQTTNLARWDGTNWNAMGYGSGSGVYFFAVAVYGNEVVVGGNFNSLAGQPLLGLARMIDSQWWSLGSGLAGSFPEIYTLTGSSNGLYVGGIFTQAGSQSVNNLAVWNITNELPAIQISSMTNGQVFNGYQTIPIIANCVSANGQITAVSAYVDNNLVGTLTTPPYMSGWSNLTSGPHLVSVTATDASGATWTVSVNITVNLPFNGPIITQQPQSETLSNGNTAVLTVVATGNGVLSYQWYKDGVAVSGATGSSLTITNSQLGDSAVYTVQVGDVTGTNTSMGAPLSILQPVTTLWVQSIGSAVNTSPAIGQGGIICIGDDNSELEAFNPAGAFQWMYPTADYVRTSASIDTNGYTYFGSTDGKIYSLTSGGSKRWAVAMGEAGEGLAIGTDGTIYCTSLNKLVLALSPNGATNWSFTLPAAAASAPVIATNGTIYISCYNGNLYAFSPGGSNLWSYPTGAPMYGNSPIIDADGTIYITTTTTNFYAINPNGSFKWRFGALGPFYCTPVIGPDGTIYVGNDGALDPSSGIVKGRLYALRPDGSEKWEFTTRGKVRSSPVVSSDGTIYFGCDDNNFYALNQDSTERWQYFTGAIIESSPALRFDGAVIFGAGNGNLYALQGSGSLANSPWPMFQHDLVHSGNAALPRVPDAFTYPFSSNEFDDQVNALATNGRDLYVGGNFQVAGGIAANGIARWNGSNWFPLGAGVNGGVNAIVVVGGNVYAGGTFTTAGGTNASYVAYWDGSMWHPMGSGMDDYVSAWAVGSNGVIAGGGFSMAGGTAARGVALWNGTNWSAIGSGVNATIMTLATDGNDLYAGGFSSGGVQHWNGTNWSSLGAIVDNSGETISALAVGGDGLYAGGTFYKIGGVNAAGIARWDGTNWYALGSGVADPIFPFVTSIAINGTNLYAGGTFTSAGGTPANRIAMWDGAQWHPLGGGMTVQTPSSAVNVDALAISGGRLYAGGAFLAADGNSNVRYLAAWNGTGWSSLGPAVAFVNGQFQILLTDQFGRTYGLQSSPDLINWTRVMTFTNLGGYSQYIETNTNASRLFYRVVIP